MLKSLAIALLLGNVSAADYSPGTTYANCQTFAGKFANTCGSVTTQTAFGSLTESSHSCDNVGECGGSLSGSTCTWQRKLCVTCIDTGSKIQIRVQTNGLPNHCYRTPQTALVAVTVDYTVDWLSTASANPVSQPSDQAGLNTLMCDIQVSKDANIPSSANYVLNAGTAQNTAWGVATTGVMFFNGISGEGVDAFYPAKYGKVFFADLAVEKVDWCQAHPQNAGHFHYHSASPCISARKANYELKSGFNDVDTKYQLQEAWSGSDRDAIGIAKDGRPIMSPYYTSGGSQVAIDDCAVDVCNGLEISGNYMYVSTFFHPYIMGCFGKGSAPELYQQCSTNPRLCNVVYIGALASIKPLSILAAGALLVSQTLY